MFFERNLKKLVVQKNFAFYIFHLSISTRNINISVRENVENARDQKKKGKICHRFIIEIRAGSSIEFEIPKRYGGCDDAGQSN